jgi:hypothetical protein
VDPELGGHGWEYDENGRIVRQSYQDRSVNEILYTPGGLVDRTVLHDAGGTPIAETVHSYDGLGRKVRQTTTRNADTQVVADFEWIYDELDQVEELRVYHQGVKAAFVYNERRELIREEWILCPEPPGGAPVRPLKGAYARSRRARSSSLRWMIRSTTTQVPEILKRAR